MAACEHPHNILDNPLPEIPAFLGPLSPSWNQINAAMKPLQKSSFAEIFGEMLFKEPESFSSSAFSSSAASLYSSDSSSAASSSSSSSSSADATDTEAEIEMLTGEEINKSSDDVDPEEEEEEEMMMIRDLGIEERPPILCRRHSYSENRCSEWKRSKMIRAAFPPPISCIGRSGKPWVLFKSYREDGRFILKEIRIPTQEFMHACRKDGRLKLHIIQSDDEIPDDDEYDEDDDEEEDNREVVDDDTTEEEEEEELK